MPKNTVTDPITGQEMAFAHLVLSGTMTDRHAAEAAGLNPETAAYTKAKPRVRAYMVDYRAAVKEKLVDQEVEALRKLNPSREQILNRLWELATLSHEATRGSIAGQVKALSMILAIEGLIPDRRRSEKNPPAPPVEPDIYEAEWLRKRQQPAADEESGDPVAVAEPQPDEPHIPEPHIPEPVAGKPAPNLGPDQPNVANSLIPDGFNWVPLATGNGFEGLRDTRQPFSIKKGRFGRR
jgi:hypothetical protein